MNRFKVPVAATLFMLAGVFAALEFISVYSLLTAEPVTFISRTEQHDDIVIEHRVGFQVSGPLAHLLVLAIIACSTTAALLVLRTSRAQGQTDSAEAP